MNGTAEQITVTIAASSRFPKEALEELYKGIEKACELYEVDLVGGDTTSSVSGLMISITAIGTRSEEHTSELQSRPHLVCRLLLEKKKINNIHTRYTHTK